MCWGLSDSSLSALPRRVLDEQSKLAHPELYNDALSETKFFCLLSKQLRICGYSEFGFRDLASPQARRFKKQLSALINFLKYREDMIHLETHAIEEVSLVIEGCVCLGGESVIVIFFQSISWHTSHVPLINYRLDYNSCSARSCSRRWTR